MDAIALSGGGCRDSDVAPFADCAPAMAGDAALARHDVFFAHQAERERARPELEGNVGILADFAAVNRERYAIGGRVVRDLEVMELARRGSRRESLRTGRNGAGRATGFDNRARPVMGSLP